MTDFRDARKKEDSPINYSMWKDGGLRMTHHLNKWRIKRPLGVDYGRSEEVKNFVLSLTSIKC